MNYRDRLMMATMYRMLASMLAFMLMLLQSTEPSNIYKEIKKNMLLNEEAIDEWIEEAKRSQDRRN